LVFFFGRPFVKQFALCYQPIVCPVLSVQSVCDVGLLWPDGWIDQGATWYGDRPLPTPHCVRCGTQLPKRGTAVPQFSTHVYCGQTARLIKMPLGAEVGLGPGHIVLNWGPSSPEKRRHSSPRNFRPMSIVAKQLDGSRCHMVRR